MIDMILCFLDITVFFCLYFCCFVSFLCFTLHNFNFTSKKSTIKNFNSQSWTLCQRSLVISYWFYVHFLILQNKLTQQEGEHAWMHLRYISHHINSTAKYQQTSHSLSNLHILTPSLCLTHRPSPPNKLLYPVVISPS
jgi:hypothetical protein